MLGLSQYKTRFVCRFTIELTAPLSIGSGQSGLYEDQLFVSDANGLPAIPASSFVGVLRHRWQEVLHFHPDLLSEGDLFGDIGYGDHSSGQKSRIELSWGMIHDSQNQPVEGIHPLVEIEKDPILSAAYHTILTRDLVRISHRGVAEDGAKFDRSSIMPGNRFSFELVMTGDSKDQSSFEAFLALISDEHTLLGAHSRSGLGSFKVVSCQTRAFDLSQDKDFEALLTYPTSMKSNVTHLLKPLDLEALKQRVKVEKQSITLKLKLKPQSHFLQGGGDVSKVGDQINITPYFEQNVSWQSNRASISTYDDPKNDVDYLITGSALKGAIRHRCAFHLRRILGFWAHQSTDVTMKTMDLNMFDPSFLPGLDDLFGELKDQGSEKGKKGKVSISDLRINRQTVKHSVYDHLSIDRFSFAPMKGCLFTDMALAPNQIEVELQLRLFLNFAQIEKDADRKQHFQNACKALALSIQDLAEGRLQLGAGAGRGYGYFKSKNTQVDWVGHPEYVELLNETMKFNTQMKGTHQP
jgi:CRISPR/Cas system CSM-associated protein Csm3 (group 7 of RAMP superfamily)